MSLLWDCKSWVCTLHYCSGTKKLARSFSVFLEFVDSSILCSCCEPWPRIIRAYLWDHTNSCTGESYSQRRRYLYSIGAGMKRNCHIWRTPPAISNTVIMLPETLLIQSWDESKKRKLYVRIVKFNRWSSANILSSQLKQRYSSRETRIWPWYGYFQNRSHWTSFVYNSCTSDTTII